MIDEARRQQLAREIEAAFADTVYPGDDLGDPDEVGMLVGKDWRDLSTAYVLPRSQALFFLNTPGLIYFLPAFLLAWLRDPSGADAYNLPSTLLAVLGPVRDDLPEIVARLTPIQCALVKTMLNVCPELAALSLADQNALDDALLWWWGVAC